MNVSFTAEIDRITRGHGIVDIGGKEVDIGPCSRSDVGRTVKFVKSHGTIQYCIRPAYLYKFNNSGNGIISTQSGHLNIGPVSQDYLRSYVDIVPHGNKAYCVTKDATDAAYPYTQYSRISDPIETDWFPLSTKHHNIELEISEIRGDVAFAMFGEYSSLTVRIPLFNTDISPQEGAVVSVTPHLDKLSSLPDEMEASLNEIISSSKDSSNPSATSQSGIQSKSEANGQTYKEDSSGSEPSSQPDTESNTEESKGVVKEEDSPHKYNADLDALREQSSSPTKKETISQSEPVESEEQTGGTQRDDNGSEPLENSNAKPSLDTLRQKAEESSVEDVSDDVSKTTVEKTQYRRSKDVKEYVMARADGLCEGCDEPAPFMDNTGEPYLHAHHVHELSSGGSDTPDTVIALCPNCHYRVHHGEEGSEYNKELKQKLESIEEKAADSC
jgi:predicted HNH restriction endonuclease